MTLSQSVALGIASDVSAILFRVCSWTRLYDDDRTTRCMCDSSFDRTYYPTVKYAYFIRKASSLDIAPFTILDSGALQPRKWQLTGIDSSTAAQASGYP